MEVTTDSTIFYTNDEEDEEGIELVSGGHNDMPAQQSFIFGADQFQATKRVTKSVTRNFKTDTGAASVTWAKTNWRLVVRHWLLSLLFLPLYAFAVVTHAWKNAARSTHLANGTITRSKGTAVILFSVVFYGLLWTMIALLIAFPVVKHTFPPQGAIFVLFLYAMCCFAEASLKNTHIPQRPDDEEGLVNSAIIKTLSGKEMSVKAFMDTVFSLSEPAPRPVTGPLLASVLTTIGYTCFVLLLHFYTLRKANTFEAVLVAYCIIVTILQCTLCFIILYPIAQVGLRLYTRDNVAKLFAAATTTRQAHSFHLTTLQNIQSWQMIRDTLLKLYAFPALYVDVVLSTAFTLWVPLVIVGVMDFVLRASITNLALNATTLAVLILGYLFVCVVLASQVQETLSNTDVLRWQEYRFIIRAGAGNSEQEDFQRLTLVLKRLADLIDKGRDNAIVFQVYSFALNRRMATVLGGILVTLSSSIFVRAASNIS